MDHHAQRRENLARIMHDEGLDALLVSSPVNVTYLTGFTGDSSALVLARGRALPVSAPRHTGPTRTECPALDTYIRSPPQQLPEAIGVVLTQLPVRSVGCESAALTLAEAEALRQAATVDFKPGSDRVERLRMVKDAVE